MSGDGSMDDGKGTLRSARIRAFVPGGRDFQLSIRFYETLGFTKTFEIPELALFAHDGGEFFLQNFHHDALASLFMMQLVVADLDAWWAHIDSLDLAGRFGVRPPRAPTLMPWGAREIHLIGPGGELWHIAQA